MNLEKLEAQIAALEQGIVALRSQLEAAKKQRDPLSAHVFRSRIQFQDALRDDTSKSGRWIESTQRSTFQTAVDLGYTSSFDSWCALLTAKPKQRKREGAS